MLKSEVVHLKENWFTIESIDTRTFRLSEYKHWEETHSYLLLCGDRALLIDSGMGIGNIKAAVSALTRLPVTAAATHVHWDHIGGHGLFPEFYVHEKELHWITGAFPLPLSAVRKQLTAEPCDFPPGFDPDIYHIFSGMPARVLTEHDTLDFGSRRLYALHTPGHSPGHMCFWEPETRYLFTGDLVYEGTLLASFPTTDPNAYLRSLRLISTLPPVRIFPSHHAPDPDIRLVKETCQAFQALKNSHQLRHGAGFFRFGSFSIQL